MNKADGTVNMPRKTHPHTPRFYQKVKSKTGVSQT